MTTKELRKLEDYYDPKVPLEDRFDQLCDTNDVPSHNVQKVNDLVMGFTVKYLCTYLGIGDDVRVSDIGEIVRDRIDAGFTSKVLYAFQAVTAVPGERVRNAPETYAIECNADIRSTSAIFREIALEELEIPVKTDDKFYGADLGSGTGILSPGIAIAAYRAGYKNVAVGLIDSNMDAVTRSRLILKKLNRFDVYCVPSDLRDKETYEAFGRPDIDLKYVVSETFGTSTPRITSISETSCEAEQNGVSKKAVSYDPYIDVLQNLLSHCTGFHKNVRSGHTRFFPDAINKRFTPDGCNGRILLKTAVNKEPMLFHEIQDEFEEYEDLGTPIRRWSSQR